MEKELETQFQMRRGSMINNVLLTSFENKMLKVLSNTSLALIILDTVLHLRMFDVHIHKTIFILVHQMINEAMYLLFQAYVFLILVLLKSRGP